MKSGTVSKLAEQLIEAGAKDVRVDHSTDFYLVDHSISIGKKYYLQIGTYYVILHKKLKNDCSMTVKEWVIRDSTDLSLFRIAIAVVNQIKFKKASK